MALDIFGGKRLSSPNISPMEGGPPVKQPPAAAREPTESPGRGSFSARSGLPEHPLHRADRNAALKRRSAPSLMAKTASVPAARRSLDLTRPASPPASSRPSSASFGARLGSCLERLGLFKSGGAKLEGCRKSLDATIDSLTWLTDDHKARFKATYAEDRDGSRMKACVASLRKLGTQMQTQKRETLTKQVETAATLNGKLRAKAKSAPHDVTLQREKTTLERDVRKQVATCRQTKAELTMIGLGLRTLQLVDLNLKVTLPNSRNDATRPMPG